MSICVFGDSIAWGSYDPVGGGWVTLLRKYCEENWEKLGDIAVYNLGIFGDTTTSLLKRFENEIVIRDADIVIFAIGVNDASNWNSQNNPVVDLDTFKDNLKKLTVCAKQYVKKLIFIGLTPTDDRVTNPFDNENTFEMRHTNTYNEALKYHCAEVGATFINVINRLELSDLDDGVHPNHAGHLKLFDNIRPVVEKSITESLT